MGAFSESMRKTAESLIVRYGSDVTLVKATPVPLIEAGTLRPYWLDEEGKVSYDALPTLRYKGYATQKNVEASEAVDGRIRTTDLIFSLVHTPEPTTRDYIEWLNIKYTIIHVVPKYVQGESVIYLAYGRRS